MTTRSHEINELIVEMQTYISMGDFDNVSATSERIERLCREDLDEMLGFRAVVPGTLYEFWLKQVAINKAAEPNHIPNRLVGESELYRHNQYRMSRPDVDPITPNDELDSGRVKFVQGHSITRAQLMQKLEEWRLEAVELGLGLCALKLMEEREAVERLGEPDAIAFASQVVGACLMRMAEKKSQNVMGGRYGTRAVIRNEQPTGRSKETRNIDEVEIPYTGRLKGVVQTDVPENEMPPDIHGKPADIIMDKLAIIPKRPDFGIRSMGSYMDHTKPTPYNVKYETNQSVMDRVDAEKEMLQVFCTILSKEMADRLARDLEHLINITDDPEYAEAISQEVRRIRLFAEGRIKTLSDVNFAWVYHK